MRRRFDSIDLKIARSHQSPSVRVRYNEISQPRGKQGICGAIDRDLRLRPIQPSNLKSVDPTLVTMAQALNPSASDLDLINGLNHCTRAPHWSYAAVYTYRHTVPGRQRFSLDFSPTTAPHPPFLTRWCRRVMVQHCAAADIHCSGHHHRSHMRPSTPHILQYTSKISVRR